MTKVEQPRAAIASLILAVGVLALCQEPIRGDTLHVKGDTNINLATPTQVNGATTSLFVRNSGGGGERHTFLQIDLSTLPTGVPVSQGSLRVYVSAVADPGPIEIHPVLGPWDEASLSAANAPPIGPSVGSAIVSIADQGDFLTVDSTPLVQGWLDGPLCGRRICRQFRPSRSRRTDGGELRRPRELLHRVGRRQGALAGLQL